MVVPNLKISFIFKVVYVLNVLAFVIHTVGLGLRAYLSGHAPWSNGYESMVYIAWALSLSGIFSPEKSYSLVINFYFIWCCINGCAFKRNESANYKSCSCA